METKIRAIADNIHTADAGFTLAYKNASVEFTDGQFWIISGSVGRYYTGTNRTSVQVAAGSSADCHAMLGFDLQMTSEALSAVSVKESVLTQNYTSNTADLHVQSGLGVVAGDCLMITDGTNTDYFTAISGTTDTVIKVPTSAGQNYVGIANNYSYLPSASGTGSKVQLLREQDPDGVPTAYYTDIDAITRFGVKSMINQIDYSS